MNPIDALYLLCAAQGPLVFALLWARRQNRSANRLLAFATLAVAASSVYVLYVRTGLYQEHPRWLFANATLPALYGPLFYLYARSLTGTRLRSNPSGLHFIPFAVYTLCELPRLLLAPNEKLEIFLRERAGAGDSDLQLAAALAVDALGLCYFVAALLHVQRYRRTLAGRYSNYDRISLRWLSWLLSALLVLWLGSMAGYVSEHSLLIYVHASLAVVMYAIAYSSVVQPQIIAGQVEDARPVRIGRGSQVSQLAAAGLGLDAAVALELVSSPPPSAAEPVPEQLASPDLRRISDPGPDSGPLKHLKARLKPEQTQAIAQRIERLFDSDKLYLNPELALLGLSDQLKVPAQQLSQVLNEYFARSFYDFVNGYRVEELKRRLRDPSYANDKISSLGLACGFSTKSALHANFRKHAGMTPQEYREHRQLDSLNREQPSG